MIMGISLRAGSIWAIGILSSLLLAFPADAAKLYFSINDATSGSNFKESGDFACNSSSDVLNIAGTYDLGGGKSITIAAIDGSASARITCDEAADILTLKHAKITTTTPPVENVKISFWRTYSGATNPADYSVSGNGTFGGTPSGAWLSLRGYVAGTSLGLLSDPSNPPGCAGVLTKCPSNSAATWSFTSSTFSVTSTIDPLSSPRDLKGNFWFKLVSNSHLIFNSAKGIQIKLGSPPGQGPDEPCCPKGSQCLTCTPESEVRWLCKSFGWYCPVCIIPENGIILKPVDTERESKFPNP
jgi:hypothetical protein